MYFFFSSSSSFLLTGEKENEKNFKKKNSFFFFLCMLKGNPHRKQHRTTPYITMYIYLLTIKKLCRYVLCSSSIPNMIFPPSFRRSIRASAAIACVLPTNLQRNPVLTPRLLQPFSSTYTRV